MRVARHTVQAGLLLLTLLGVFLLGRNAEAWCPFGGVEAIYTYLHEGNLLCSLGISNFYVLAALILTVVLVRRAFCGYLCPIGAISEWLRILARRAGLRGTRVPQRIDRVLSLGKYVVLAIVLAATWELGELAFRGYCPAYALISRHGADITVWAYVVLGAIVVASLFLALPFCRWFCPLAAVLNPFSRFGIGRIKRDAACCTQCGRCASACPMAIPVDRLPRVTASRCLTCMNCVEVCPKKEQGAIFWGPPAWIGRAWPRAAVIAVLLLSGGAAVAAAYLAPLPSFVKTHGELPAHTAFVDLRVEGLTCRGRANLLVGFLERDDLYQIPGASPDLPGFFKLEAWPDPNTAIVRVFYDPQFADADAIRRAIVEPYYDLQTDRWWSSPFVIEGYDPSGLSP